MDDGPKFWNGKVWRRIKEAGGGKAWLKWERCKTEHVEESKERKKSVVGLGRGFAMLCMGSLSSRSYLSLFSFIYLILLLYIFILVC